MVRLKEKPLGEANLSFRISIPYGAIKRFFLCPSLNDKLVFQFLMVRLKATGNVNFECGIYNFNSLWCD